jgi:alpha-L-rhamnosidase
MSLIIENMKTEYAVNPQGLDSRHPRLSWTLESAAFAQKQTAYRILAASSLEKLQNHEGDLWDSGKVDSDLSIHIQYQGTALQSEQVCFWKVMVWDKEDQPSRWSKASKWSMGLLQKEDWKGQWIGREKPKGDELLPVVYLRKGVNIDKPIHRATAYSTALGVYNLYINGQKISEDLFAPGWTDYKTRVQYQSYDVTQWFAQGENVLGALLGSGWYCGHVGMMGKEEYGDQPYFLCQLHIEYEDGSTQEIVTDETWKTSEGPILYSDMIMGETYDATKALSDWSAPGFNDGAWDTPVVLPEYSGKLTAQVDPPVQVTEQILPVSVRKLKESTYIFDMGQNMIGWIKLKVTGEKGQQIKVSYAEMLNADGSLYIENLRKARQENIYILNGDEEESFEPHFTFHGFRYVEVSGLSETPTLDRVIGKVIHSANPSTGSMETSDVMVNKLHSNISWGQRGNFLSVPTDCPQRDERLGWTGDAQIFAGTACYLVDAARFFSKYSIDMNDAQLPSGAFTDTAPDGGYYKFRTNSQRLKWMAPDNAAWADAGVIIPWTVYQVYGDKAILESSYEPMIRWVEYSKETSTGLIRPDWSNYGDWLSIDADTPKDVLATAYFAYSTKLMSRISKVLGKSEDAAKYEKLFSEICSAFENTFVDAEGKIKGDTQTVYVLALQFNILTEKNRELAIKHLVKDIESRDYHLTTGFLGVGYLLPALTDSGQSDVAYKLLQQNTFPSWLYSVKHGATTIWERWDGWTDHNGFQTPTMNSFNHYSLGSVAEWMYKKMAGIDTDLLNPGYKHIIFKPIPGGDLSHVKSEFESIHGTIRSEWSIEGKYFTFKVKVPVNTTATVWLPGAQPQCDETEEETVRYEGINEGKHRYEIGSGTYEFNSVVK